MNISHLQAGIAAIVVCALCLTYIFLPQLVDLALHVVEFLIKASKFVLVLKLRRRGRSWQEIHYILSKMERES